MNPDFPEQFREDVMEQAIFDQQTQIDELATTIRFFTAIRFATFQASLKRS
jgi:hypothetical protein